MEVEVDGGKPIATITAMRFPINPLDPPVLPALHLQMLVKRSTQNPKSISNSVPVFDTFKPGARP